MANATLCFTGFAREDLGQVQEQFERANAASGHRWQIVPEAEADVLVIDMDSMYGHMTWLKAASSKRRTVGVTAGDRCETDFMVRRPLDAGAFESLIRQLESGRPDPVAEASAPEDAQGDAAGADPVADAPAEEFVPVEPAPSADYIAAVTTGQMAALPENPVPHRPSLSDLLAPGALGAPSRLQVPGAPDLVLDPASASYAGSATLKPLLPYVQAELSAADATPVDPAQWDAAKAGAQPYMRLLWLCGLTVGEGHLLPGFAPSRKFVLTKWPQIEREFPKHFRIATVMMKGPALVQEVADATGASLGEVCDFVNAGLVSGAVIPEGSEPVGGTPARAASLLARPRAG